MATKAREGKHSKARRGAQKFRWPQRTFVTLSLPTRYPLHVWPLKLCSHVLKLRFTAAESDVLEFYRAAGELAACPCRLPTWFISLKSADTTHMVHPKVSRDTFETVSMQHGTYGWQEC